MTKNTPSTGIDQFAAADMRAVANTRKPATGLPAKQGLYDPRNEHDACGVGFVAHRTFKIGTAHDSAVAL